MKNKAVLSNNELSSFCGQIALVLKAGITPKDGLEILLNDTKEENIKKIMIKLLESSNAGDNFTTSIKKSEVFPSYVENMVAIGEQSGKLDDVMQALSEYYEKEELVSENVRNAITYPFIMIVMMLFIIFILIAKVLPLFNQVFIQLGTEISGIPAYLLRVGHTFQNYSIFFICILIILVLLYLYFSKTTHGKLLFSRACSVLGPTKKFYHNIAYGRFASGMALTLSSGMGIYESLDLVYHLVDNKEMEEKITKCKQVIIGGGSFADALFTSNIFNNLYSRMISVGVKTGDVDIVLHKIASNYEEDTDKKIRNFISIIEPTLVITLSLIVGLILLSVILPLLSIMTSIG